MTHPPWLVCQPYYSLEPVTECKKAGMNLADRQAKSKQRLNNVCRTIRTQDVSYLTRLLSIQSIHREVTQEKPLSRTTVIPRPTMEEQLLGNKCMMTTLIMTTAKSYSKIQHRFVQYTLACPRKTVHIIKFDYLPNPQTTGNTFTVQWGFQDILFSI